MKGFLTCAGVAAAVALGCGGAEAQTRTDSGGTSIQSVYDVSGATHAPLYCQVTATPTPTLLSTLLASVGCAPIPIWATLAFVTPETSSAVALRYRADGLAPTPSVGQPIAGYQPWPLQGSPVINAASLVSANGGSVTVSVEIRG